MATKSRKRGPAERSPAAGASSSAESKAAQFVTVGWLLATLTTLLCEVAALACWGLVAARPDWQRARLLAGLLVFAALVIGTISLGLLSIAWRADKTKPPRPIVVFSLIVGAIPVVLMLAQGLLLR